MSTLVIDSLRKSFGRKTALDGVNLSVAHGEFFCLLGPTNAGKTTLLKSIAGLHRPESGTVRIDGVDVGGWEPAARDISLLFQNVALFPDRDGFENIAFPLRRRRLAENDIRRRVFEIAELLRITQILARRPGTFSGGELQRVAIGRAIAQPSRLLLLDEPLSNLDAKVRADLRREFRRLHKTFGQTILYVTHDQAEAMSLADRLGVINQGKIVQVGTVDELYDRPETRFVAEFIGSPPFNLLSAQSDGGKLVIEGTQLPVAGLPAGRDLPAELRVAVRPEAVRLERGQSATTPFAADLDWVEQQGARTLLGLRLGAERVVAVAAAEAPLEIGQRWWIGFDIHPLQVLDAKTGRFLRPE